MTDNPQVTLSIDAMSGDRGFPVVVEAIRQMAVQRPELRFIVVGDAPSLEAAWPDRPDFCEIRHASEVVRMDDNPAEALRRKKQSSMRIAIDLVKSGEAAACVSAGNTGALMATARFVLKTIPGIDRPAIMAELPTRDGRLFMLDVGANASCSAEQLYQFAIMGDAVAASLMQTARPRIGLLNIGSEDIKGNDAVREAAAKLQASPLAYCGFVEGNSLFDGTVDVVVADGFSGNVALKTMEGSAKLIAGFVRESFSSGIIAKIQGLLAGPALSRLRARLDPRAYNGASLVGLSGIVVKSHGGADAVSFAYAIETAALEIRDNLPEAINRRLNEER